MARIEIVVEPLGGPESALEFWWDDETGELGGPDAEQVREAAEEAREAGSLSHPSGLYTEADPLTAREGMAMLLVVGLLYRVPDELADDLPELPEGYEDDSDVPVVY